MSDNKRNGGYGKGYYIALILCAAAIGITGYVYNRNTNRQTEELAASLPEATGQVGMYQEDVAVIATRPTAKDPSTPATEAPQPTQGKSGLKPQAPVAGKTKSGYSMEALSYNETTRDWRVHNGMDIAAEAGTEVSAAADGEVYTVYEDDTLGNTVVIRHTGGYTTRYSSLGDDLAVKAGDQVTAGQVIGTVGETALVETAMGPHVHFSVSYQDAPMDPEEFLALGE